MKKTTNNTCWQGYGKHRTLVNCRRECKLVQPLWKTVNRFLKKLKIELPQDPAIPLLDIYLKKMKTLVRKNIRTPTFIAALFTKVKTGKQPKCTLRDEWRKMWYTHTYTQ